MHLIFDANFICNDLHSKFVFQKLQGIKFFLLFLLFMLFKTWGLNEVLNYLGKYFQQGDFILHVGDSGENCPLRPIRNVVKTSFGFEWDCYQMLGAIKIHMLPQVWKEKHLPDVRKFAIISKWKFFCVWDHGQDFGNYDLLKIWKL